LEEITVQKLECRKCGHYRIGTPDKIEELIEDFKCPRCYAKPGHARTRQYSKCAQCGLTMLDDRKCFCPDNQPLFKIMPTPWKTITEAEKIQQDIKNAQTKRKFIDKSIARKKEEKNREKQMADNLQRIADALTKKEPKLEPKEMNNSAIQ